jgi:signal peptidase II
MKIVRNGCYLLLAMAVIGIDRLTKRWALTYCTTDCSIDALISCKLAFNRGLSWGIFDSQSPVTFWLVTIFVILVTVAVAAQGVYRLAHYKNAVPEMLIVSGSIANIIDRFWYGGVVDFIVLSYKGWTFPYFNCADAAIVFGVFLLFIRSMREMRK